MKPSIAARMIAAFATVGLAGTPVLADTHHAENKSTLDAGRSKVKKLGDLFDLAPRRAGVPEGDVPLLKARPKALSDAQISRVLKKQLSDVEYCWNKLPAPSRKTDTTAVVKLGVETTGVVYAVEVDSDVPESAQKCIAAAANRWTFPTTEAESEVEIAVALRAM